MAIADIIKHALARPEKAHSRLGASKADRWEGCSGSPREEAACPPKAAGKYADEGTDAHLLGELCLTYDLPACDFVGEMIRKTKVTPEMAAHVQVYVDCVHALLDQAGEGAELHLEASVSVAHLHPDLWGTVDAMIVVPFVRAIVIDFKYGVQPVEADCPQGAMYALAPWDKYDTGEVVFGIVQPRAIHHDGPIRMHTYLRDELERNATRFKLAAEATDKPDAPLASGDWCKYCLRAPTCPKLHQNTLALAQSDFTKAAIVPPAPHTLTSIQLRTILDQADTITGWIKSVHAYAMSEALMGRPPDGYKLIAGRKGNRKWTDEEKVAGLVKATGIEPYEQVLMSPADVEKTLGKKDFKELLGELVAQSEGKPELALLADKRPAITAGPASDFAVIEAEVWP